VRKPRRIVEVAVMATLWGLLGGACRSERQDAAPAAAPPAATPGPGAPTIAPPPTAGLLPVTLPDLASMNEGARKQMQARSSALQERIADRRATPADIGSAYGELGKLLMAATVFDAAESCFLNARTLLPADRRWPYYLGHLYKAKGPLDKSIASFEQALRLAPTDVATLVWLGDAYLSQGRTEPAAALFARALTLQPRSAAALFGAGRTALANRDYATAVRDLEEALKLDPRGSSIHYPLAMAYRGEGNGEQAQAHLARRGDLEVRPTDPLMQELDTLLQSGEAYNVRGGRELDAGNWAAAAEVFRQGLALAPNDPSLRHRLGTALYQMGDAAGAIGEFERVIKTSPEFAKAHFSLGVVLAERGQYREAAERFADALTYDPGYVQARVQLANVLARSGRPDEALAEYSRALEQSPTLSEAAMGYAFTLVRLQRYQDARDRLADGMKAHPEQPMFAHALARLLATAPDPRVRDGRRAIALVEQLLKDQQTVELGETSAMALAELGHYAQAVQVQRDLMTAAERAGITGARERLERNLKLYERGAPCRTPFTQEEMPLGDREDPGRHPSRMPPG
jgi:tetratricopeptide (TPR) repeat protein